MINLFEPYKIGSLELKNRFVRSATWDNTADINGAVTDASLAVYRNVASGGVGLIMTGFAYVAPLGQALPRQYGAHTDAMIPGLQRLVQAAHQGGAKIALQIVHAGINSPFLIKMGMTALAVSNKPGSIPPGMLPSLSRKEEINIPHREITDEEIESTLLDFAAAAVRARRAGFDAVQLHGAHGYLMSQFLSPLFNLRSDRWGGNTEKRRRFHLELVREVRRAVGDGFPLLIKFGVQDDHPGGLALSEGLETARQMVREGIDAIEVSAGIGVAPSTAKTSSPEPVLYRDRAAAVKQVVSVPVIAVQGIRSLGMAQSIIDHGDADLISMCRPLILEPDLIARWQRGETGPSKCTSCQKCHSLDDDPVHCRTRINQEAEDDTRR
jgi:2,4-dienoyl-CoA reductase-like NADH-dependent reductase (Old Yellow Enzyme family)